jgi:hypothetical protein
MMSVGCYSGPMSHGCNELELGYQAIHARVRETLPPECAWADETCSPLLDVALRHETPREFVRIAPWGPEYSVRGAEDYIRLCKSHHIRYDRPRAVRACSVGGCSKPATRRGWCAKHYMRWYREQKAA